MRDFDMVVHSAVCPLQVGRESELSVLVGLADRRAATLVAGQAGVGKSRFGSEVVRLAAERGLSSLIGASASETTVSYAPFATALRRRTRSMDAVELAELFAGPARAAAAILPEVGRVVDVSIEVVDQSELFAAVWLVLARLAGDMGALLLLEDLHWADSDSLRMLGYLVRESDDLPVWIVGTYRYDELHRRHPLTSTLAELTRERRVEEIRLEPLGLEQVRLMVSAILDGAEIGDEFANAIFERTEGNPFFVEELIKVFLERGDIYFEDGSWERRGLADIEIPDSVRETLLTRLRVLDDSALDLLHLAALSGERLDTLVLARAASLDPANVDRIISEGLRLQLLTEVRSEGGWSYAFRHALTREALVDDLVGPERQRLHRRLADAILEVHDDDIDAASGELAVHYNEAGDTERSVEFGLRAARRAAASHSPDEAGRLYDRALRLIPENSPERLELLLEAAEALINAPDRRLGVAFATQARQIARQRSDAMNEARALDVIQRDAWSSGESLRAVELMREAVRLTRGTESQQEAMMVARFARLLALVDERTEALATITEGLALAERVGNDRALSTHYSTRLMANPDGPQFEADTELALAAARRAGDERVENNLTTNVGYILLWRGYLGRSREFLRRATEWYAENLPHDRYAEAGFAWLLSLRGEYDEALRIASSLRGNSMAPTRIVALTALGEVALRRGGVDLDALVDELVTLSLRSGEAQRSVPALAVRARWALEGRGVDEALPLFWEALDKTVTMIGTGSHWMFSPDIARALLDEAQRADLETWAARIASLTLADPIPHNVAAGSLTRAHLLALQRDVEGARAAYADAASRFHDLPCPAREAESVIGMADLEGAAGRPEESAAAARRAESIAASIGAHYLVARASAAGARALAPTALLTVLFTDIVSSTERLVEVGDAAWNAQLERHNSLVRRELSRHGGREVKTTGDGFLATFDSPAGAIRCALAVRDGLGTMDIDVRAGLHTGECQIVGDDVAGLAVHIAARVNALAGRGEVLVSSTVRDLVAGSAIVFEDRGSHALKGVSGEWRLFAVVP